MEGHYSARWRALDRLGGVIPNGNQGGWSGWSTFGYAYARTIQQNATYRWVDFSTGTWEDIRECSDVPQVRFATQIKKIGYTPQLIGSYHQHITVQADDV